MAFSDDFNRSNENLSASSDWTLLGGTATGLQVSSNQVARAVATATQDAVACPDQSAIDAYVEATVSGEGGSFIALRLTDANNFIGFRYYDVESRWEVYKRDSGSFTLLGSYSASLTAGDVGRLSVASNVFTLRVNGVVRVTTGADAFNASETKAGLIGRGGVVGTWIDDFNHGSAVRARIGFAGARMAGGRMG